MTDVEYLKNVYSSLEPGSPEMYALSTILNNADKTRDSIFGTASSTLQPLVQSRSLMNMMSENEFSYKSILDGNTVVFLVVPDEKRDMDPLVSIMVKDLYTYLVEEASKRRDCCLEHRVNMILDEFANFPKIPDMSRMMSAARSRNIRFMLFIQSLNQLRTVYRDEAETIKGNALDWIFLTSKDLLTLNEISELCGMEFSTTFLQRMEKGQSIVLVDRLPPRLTMLSDISEVPHTEPEYVPNPIEHKDRRNADKDICKAFDNKGCAKDLPNSSFSSNLVWAVIDEKLDEEEIADRILKSLLFHLSDISSEAIRKYLRKHKGDFVGSPVKVCRACNKLLT